MESLTISSILGALILTFFAMEFMAWFMHKFVMHGFLWNLHEDHHVVTPGFFQKNDSFALMFAIPSFFLMLFGSLAGYDLKFWIGSGILVYGIAYTIVHEIFIHRRAHWFGNGKNWYSRALRKAHLDHHFTTGKEGARNFGMLIVHPKYYVAEIKKLRQKRSLSTAAKSS